MGGTPARTGVRGCAELSRDGPAGGIVDGEAGCAGGFACRAEGRG